MNPERSRPILVTSLVTRGYELASTGVVPPSVYLRYLEHQRWQAMSDDAAVPIRRFWGIGVVRAQQLELYEQTGFHEPLTLTLWLSRIGRTSCDLSHTIHRARDEVLVARSTATVVALDSQRRPREVMPSARDFLLNRGGCRLDRPPTTAPGGAWNRSIDIRPSDQDLQQHVNHARYADYVEDARLQCAAAGGYGSGDFSARTRTLYLEYDREARVGDALTVSSWMIDGTRCALGFELSATAGVVARARVELFG